MNGITVEHDIPLEQCTEDGQFDWKRLGFVGGVSDGYCISLFDC